MSENGNGKVKVVHCKACGAIGMAEKFFNLPLENGKKMEDLTLCDKCARIARKQGVKLFPYLSSLELVQARQKRQEEAAKRVTAFLHGNGFKKAKAPSWVQNARQAREDRQARDNAKQEAETQKREAKREKVKQALAMLPTLQVGESN